MTKDLRVSWAHLVLRENLLRKEIQVHLDHLVKLELLV